MKVVYRGGFYLIVHRGGEFVWMRKWGLKGDRVFYREPADPTILKLPLPLTAELKRRLNLYSKVVRA